MHGGVGSDRDNNEWKPVLPSLSFPKFKHTFISLWPALQRTESKSCVSFGSSNPFKFKLYKAREPGPGTFFGVKMTHQHLGKDSEKKKKREKSGLLPNII